MADSRSTYTEVMPPTSARLPAGASARTTASSGPRTVFIAAADSPEADRITV